jgi:glutamate racemase
MIMTLAKEMGARVRGQQSIAILDSGVGGLTVAREIMRQLPLEPIIYFGDTFRAPYGSRSEDEIRAFTEEIVNFLLPFQPKMIVIACNTATAAALGWIRSRVKIPVIGVISPGARAAMKATRRGRIGVIGTEGTVRSGAYERALRRISPQVKVFSLACPALVPIVEQGMVHLETTKVAVAKAIQPLHRFDLDTLILGCTHYPFLSEVIQEFVGEDVKLISSADEAAQEISAILYHRGELSTSIEGSKYEFYCSGDPIIFELIARKWLARDIRVTSVEWNEQK